MFAEKPDQPTDLELTDQTERSVRLTWVPGDNHNSPTQSKKRSQVSLLQLDAALPSINGYKETRHRFIPVQRLVGTKALVHTQNMD